MNQDLPLQGAAKTTPTTLSKLWTTRLGAMRQQRIGKVGYAGVNSTLEVALCSGLMKPDTDLGENARHEEVSDDEAATYVFPGIQTASRLSDARPGL